MSDYLLFLLTPCLFLLRNVHFDLKFPLPSLQTRTLGKREKSVFLTLSVAFTPILPLPWKYKLGFKNSHNTVIEQEETPGSKHSWQGITWLLSIPDKCWEAAWSQSACIRFSSSQRGSLLTPHTMLTEKMPVAMHLRTDLCRGMAPMPSTHRLITCQVVLLFGFCFYFWFFLNLFMCPGWHAEERSCMEDGSHSLPQCIFFQVSAFHVVSNRHENQRGWNPPQKEVLGDKYVSQQSSKIEVNKIHEYRWLLL